MKKLTPVSRTTQKVADTCPQGEAQSRKVRLP
jgi:hypothetical protein